MKKKYWILICSIAGFILALSIFLICFFSIPRVVYGYDSYADTYYVDYVYGNASSYIIKDKVHDKPVTKIKARAFMKKSNLKDVVLGKNIDEIERLAFLDCKKLKNINLDSVKVIGRNAFENCISLEEIHLSLADILGGAFIGCKSLSKVELEDVYSIGSYAFANTSIIKIEIPKSCSLVGEEAFYGCESLKRIIVYSYSLRNNSYLNSLNGVEFVLN
ncbi:MAG: leucine-rich repeat domain-containing protein [Roseburia sp.]|nr:leucine-rich repeat domain-containing protein [Anaeroplasma bactoclasticum]MCM1196345.1 leucine-rich repeat domain-containing protein [Roseburia sp.]MCM1556478.1 leucine-rich repeat domain-containing protein [Anaeroplasma bactoclasticum]